MDLKEKARIIRTEVIRMLANAGNGHTAGPLSSADFWTALYFGDLIKYKANNPNWEERDRVVLSAGHYCPVLYAVLAEAGFFDRSELATLRRINGRLQGHPIIGCVPGIETSSGSLGQGISQAIGMALTARLDGKSWRTICFMGDGEQDEGQVWEAYMLAGKEKLGNLTLVIDRNQIQIDGYTENVMPIEPLHHKLSAFNLNVIEVDGHDHEAIIDAINQTKAITEKTSVIILKTISGKGVSFMENDYTWHGKAPTPEEALRALKELK
jgi:transketolase